MGVKMATEGTIRSVLLMPRVKIALSTMILFSLIATALCAQENQPAAAPETHVQFRIIDKDSGKLIPGKLLFLREGTGFKLGVKSGGTLASRNSTIYSLSGEGHFKAPPGTYQVWANRGVEYSVDVQDVTLLAGKKNELEFRISRVVQTPGFIGGDLHLHTFTHSGHGDATMEERVISCIAEGLEWVVATDHNHVVDYDTVLTDFESKDRMLATAGNEVSTPIGHFNTFPLPVGSAPIPSAERSAIKLFKNIRTLTPDAVIQVNHPRWLGTHFFDNFKIDPIFAITDHGGWSWDFDAIEILNENRGLGWWSEKTNPVSVRQDWFNFLNTGRKFTGVGNSDSHSVISMIAGMPRNYIASSQDDPAKLIESELVKNLRKGRVSVNRGLYVEMTANDSVPIGGRIKTRNGAIFLDIRVQAPGWVACDTVEIYGNGRRIKQFAVREKEKVIRFEQRIELRPEVDTWYVAVARSATPMLPLFIDQPVPITPLGFTNPIWVDADGDGTFLTVRDRAAQLLRKSGDGDDDLVQAVTGDQLLLDQVVGYLIANDAPNKLAVFADVLPLASAKTRLAIIKKLADENADQARKILSDYAPAAKGAHEKLALLMSQYRLGDQAVWAEAIELAWGIDDPAFLKSMFAAASRGNMVRAWKIRGPFTLSADSAFSAGFNPGRPFVKSADGTGGPAWQDVEADESGIINFVDLFGKQKQSTAWAATRFTSLAKGHALLLLGSDDGVQVWINGHSVHHNTASRGVKPGDDVVVVPVEKGKNVLVVKVTNGAGGWGLVAEFPDPGNRLNFK